MIINAQQQQQQQQQQQRNATQQQEISHIIASSPTAATYVQAQLSGININADATTTTAANTIPIVTYNGNQYCVITRTGNGNNVIVNGSTAGGGGVSVGGGNSVAAGVGVGLNIGNASIGNSGGTTVISSLDKPELLQFRSGQLGADKETKTNFILMSPMQMQTVAVNNQQ